MPLLAITLALLIGFFAGKISSIVKTASIISRLLKDFEQRGMLTESQIRRVLNHKK